MSEEEIEEIKSIIKWTRGMGLLHEANLLTRILDLYNKEKEKNKELELFIQENPPIIPIPKEYQNNIESLGEVVTVKEKEYVSKDKIKELAEKKVFPTAITKQILEELFKEGE